MAVKTALVRDHLVERMLAAVRARFGAAAPGSIEAALDSALGELAPDSSPSPQLAALAARVAKAGYLARVVEAEMFEPARQPTPALATELGGQGFASRDALVRAATELSARLARAEPAGRPSPSDEHAVSWRVPGPGGHARHYLALASVEWLTGPRAEAAEMEAPLKRCWLFGFLLRCCEECISPAAHEDRG